MTNIMYAFTMPVNNNDKEEEKEEDDHISEAPHCVAGLHILFFRLFYSFSQKTNKINQVNELSRLVIKGEFSMFMFNIHISHKLELYWFNVLMGRLANFRK